MTKYELWQKAKMLPLLPGVYIIRNKAGEIIYIGKAKRLRTRVSQYFREGVPHDAKVTKMIHNAYEFDVIVTPVSYTHLNRTAANFHNRDYAVRPPGFFPQIRRSR